MHNVIFRQHPDPSYGPRTIYNASSADLTVAFAINFYTRGEKLTKSAAKDKYVSIHPFTDCDVAAEEILYHCSERMIHTINVAGNCLQTLKLLGYTQFQINKYVFMVIKEVHRQYPIRKIISGGQTGVDFAGGISAAALKIPCEMTFPREFLQRDMYGKDFTNTWEKIDRVFKKQLMELKQQFHNEDD